MPAVRSVEREAAASDYRFSAFILGIVRSVPFQMRKADDAITTVRKTTGTRVVGSTAK
jgi:hypothetical protein